MIGNFKIIEINNIVDHDYRRAIDESLRLFESNPESHSAAMNALFCLWYVLTELDYTDGEFEEFRMKLIELYNTVYQSHREHWEFQYFLHFIKSLGDWLLCGETSDPEIGDDLPSLERAYRLNPQHPVIYAEYNLRKALDKSNLTTEVSRTDLWELLEFIDEKVLINPDTAIWIHNWGIAGREAKLLIIGKYRDLVHQVNSR